MQLYAAMLLSFGFFAAHVACQPMKIAQDNYLRASCELHIFLTVATAISLKVEVDETSADHKTVLGNILTWTFVLRSCRRPRVRLTRKTTRCYCVASKDSRLV